MIKPKVIEVKDLDGDILEVTISRLPATIGREILASYPLSAIPKISEYKSNEEVMLKMMQYVKIGELTLINKNVIDNTIPDAQTLFKIEYEMLKYNTSFLGNAENSNLISSLTDKVKGMSISILKQVLQQSLVKK